MGREDGEYALLVIINGTPKRIIEGPEADVSFLPFHLVDYEFCLDMTGNRRPFGAGEQRWGGGHVKKISKTSVRGGVWALLKYQRQFWWVLESRGLRMFLTFLKVKLFGQGDGRGLCLNIPIAVLFPERFPVPTILGGEVTTRCNTARPGCERTYWPDSEKHWDLSPGQWRMHLDYMHMVGPGGSNFLNPRFWEIACRMINCVFSVVDNMATISEADIVKMLFLPIHHLTISFDSPDPKIYEELQHGAKFEKTISNIKKLVALRDTYDSPFPEIRYKCVVEPRNTIGQMFDFLELVKSLSPKKPSGADNLVEFVGMPGFDSGAKGAAVDRATVERLEKRAKELGVPLSWSHYDFVKKPMHHCTAWMEPFILMGRYVIPDCGMLMYNNRQ